MLQYVGVVASIASGDAATAAILPPATNVEVELKVTPHTRG